MSDRNNSLQEAFLQHGPETARQYLEQEYLHQQGLTNLELIQAAFDRLPKSGKITAEADRIAVTSIAFLIDTLPDARLKEAYLQKWKRLEKRAK